MCGADKWEQPEGRTVEEYPERESRIHSFCSPCASGVGVLRVRRKVSGNRKGCIFQMRSIRFLNQKTYLIETKQQRAQVLMGMPSNRLLSAPTLKISLLHPRFSSSSPNFLLPSAHCNPVSTPSNLTQVTPNILTMKSGDFFSPLSCLASM